jgi:hypothetical protein
VPCKSDRDEMADFIPDAAFEWCRLRDAAIASTIAVSGSPSGATPAGIATRPAFDANETWLDYRAL